MHIDESSLEGTLGIMNTIFCSTLELLGDDVKSMVLSFVQEISLVWLYLTRHAF